MEEKKGRKLFCCPHCGEAITIEEWSRSPKLLGQAAEDEGSDLISTFLSLGGRLNQPQQALLTAVLGAAMGEVIRAQGPKVVEMLQLKGGQVLRALGHSAVREILAGGQEALREAFPVDMPKLPSYGEKEEGKDD